MVCVELLPASAIRLIDYFGKFEEIELNKPEAVVRSFNSGYPLSANQILRFGKSEFRIIEVNTKTDQMIDYKLYEKQLKDLDPLETFENSENKACRLCLDPR